MSIDISQIAALSIISLNQMVPIALTAIGEIFAERSGVVNIGLEGIMLTSAWFAVLISWIVHSAYIGLLSGLMIGALFGLIHGTVAVSLKGDQIISGIGINIFAIGFVPFAMNAVWGVFGSYPSFGRVMDIVTPWAPLSYLVPITIAIGFMFWYILDRTRFGINVKATGENPEAADAVGIDVERTRLIATIIGGSLAGLAGAYMSIDLVGQITKEIISGRGFISLATVVFSGWRPLLGLAGGMLFGFAQGSSIWIATFPEVRAAIPHVDDILNMIPYIVTLIVVAGLVARQRVPRAIGTPYKRE